VPTLSIMIACHNQERLLPRAIASVFGQTRSPDEVLLIDDGSDDGTSAIMAECAAKHPGRARRIRNERPSGIIPVVQQGVDAMQGDYITFCAADDRLFPRFCETAMGLLENHPEAAVFTSLGRSMDEEGRDLGLDTGPIPSEIAGYLSPELCRTRLIELDGWFLGYTTIYRRQALRAIGPYDSGLGPFFDNFTSRILAMRHGACFVPEPLAAARKSPSTFSATHSSDPSVMAGVGKRAIEMMRGPYKHFVPEAYVQVFERRFRYLTGSSVAHWSVAEITRRFREATGSETAFGIPAIFDFAALLAKLILFWAYRRGDFVTTLRQRQLHRRLARLWPPGTYDRHL